MTNELIKLAGREGQLDIALYSIMHYLVYVVATTQQQDPQFSKGMIIVINKLMKIEELKEYFDQHQAEAVKELKKKIKEIGNN